MDDSEDNCGHRSVEPATSSYSRYPKNLRLTTGNHLSVPLPIWIPGLDKSQVKTSAEENVRSRVVAALLEHFPISFSLKEIRVNPPFTCYINYAGLETCTVEQLSFERYESRRVNDTEDEGAIIRRRLDAQTLVKRWLLLGTDLDWFRLFCKVGKEVVGARSRGLERPRWLDVVLTRTRSRDILRFRTLLPLDSNDTLRDFMRID